MVRTLVGVCVAVALVGCESERVRGESVEFLGHSVATSADPDQDRISRVLVTVPLGVVERAAADATTTAPAAGMAFPEQVRNETFAHFFQIASVPEGDPRSLTSPHLALRYFGVPESAVNAVSCGTQPEVPPTRLPPGFLLPPQDQGACVPGQAWRASDGTSSSDRAVVVGYDGGRLTLIEVQLTHALLLEREPFIMPLPRPAELGAAARYPTRFIGNYRTDLDAWEFALEAFEQIDQ
jgi:hypothetical protein